MANAGPNIGQLAPEIVRLDGNGERWMLSGARGNVVALFFYPGDETAVCTKQMCSVRDNWVRYQQTGAEVVGVNTDSVEKHRGFAANHKLPIRLLSDSERKTVRDYKMKPLRHAARRDRDRQGRRHPLPQSSDADLPGRRRRSP
jgi:peroxiredoxin Q/BCP